MKAIRISGMLGLFVFTVIFALYLGRASSAVADKSRPGSLPPAAMEEWLTYTDERFNFSVQYPQDWYINAVPADAGGGGVQISTYNPYDLLRNQKGTPPDYFKVEIMVVGGDPIKPHQTLSEWRHSRLDYDATKVREEKLTLINNLEGFEEKVEYFPGIEITTIYLNYFEAAYGETVLFISASPFQNQVMEETFRQILSTFQFEK